MSARSKSAEIDLRYKKDSMIGRLGSGEDEIATFTVLNRDDELIWTAPRSGDDTE